jgi:Tfp pilus assembly protein PilN
MTTTALMPVDPSVSPQQASRVLTIRANLLPQDISDGRRARLTRTIVLIAVVLVLALLGGWYWTAAAQKKDADLEFEQVTRQVAAVQLQQRQYRTLTETKNSNIVMKKQLATLLKNDLSWQNMLDLLRDTGADAGVVVTEIGGELADDATGSAGTLDDDEVGELTITGNAPQKKAVAAYVDALDKLTYVDGPFVTSLTSSGKEKDVAKGKVAFTLTVYVTDKSLCGKFSATKCKSSGGK